MLKEANDLFIAFAIIGKSVLRVEEEFPSETSY